VDGAVLLDDIERELLRFIALPPHASVVIATWVVFTWTIDSFEIAPILALVSPEKRCGKTTLLTLLSELCWRPIPTSNISPAALYQLVNTYSPTLLIDEWDAFGSRNGELRGLLNSGHSKRTASVLRGVAFGYRGCTFRTWCAKAIASIGNLPSTLMDRSVVVTMRRKRGDERTEALRQDRLDLTGIKRRLVRWSDDNRTVLSALDPLMPAGVEGRHADNWRSLLTIAQLAGGDWFRRACDAATVMTAARDDDAVGVCLLQDVRTIFHQAGVDRMRSREIVSQLAGLEGRPWAEYRRGLPVTPSQMAELLRPFAIQPRTIRFGGDTDKGYQVAQFEDAFARYLPMTGNVTDRALRNSSEK
jgi:putative DNA primase/helicase